ncbi:MAG: metal ABC transporter ATP-binding protein [Actinomycetota bacterium]|nr:metal ABC transporter ATP-binding protein [Actinomycetota bacterium]
MIELENVTAHRGGRVALRDVTLHIRPGTVTALIGPNGAGKSTLFGLISGRLRPSAGTLTLGGAVAEVLQATAVDPHLRLTVHDVVCMGRYPTCGRLRRFRPVDRAAVADAIDDVELADLRRRTLDELSGGQRQRALIGQGIAQDAPILLLDEPAAGLDGASQRRVLDIIRAQADRGRTVVFSTHHLPDAAHADLVIALDCTCVCCASPDEALEDPGVRALFVPFAPPRRTPRAIA